MCELCFCSAGARSVIVGAVPRMVPLIVWGYEFCDQMHNLESLLRVTNVLWCSLMLAHGVRRWL